MGKKREDEFESRTLIEPFDLVAIINHLEDNLSPKKPLIVTLTTENQTYGEKKDPEVIEVRDKRQISEINNLLTAKMILRNIHVSIT